MQYYDMRSEAKMKEAVRRKNPGPCKNCEERHEACHSSCEKYRAWKESLNNDMSDFCKKYAEENCGAFECKRRLRSINSCKKSLKGQGTTYDNNVRWHARRKTN